jgi:uncharacterized short protein YbdD (DUF466 family)
VSFKLNKRVATYRRKEDSMKVEFQITAPNGPVNKLLVGRKDYDTTVDVVKQYLPDYFKVVETTMLVHTNYVKR